MSFEMWWQKQKYRSTYPVSIFSACFAAWNAAQAEMRETGPCGHPKMFCRLCAELGSVNEGPHICTICEEIRLERAAVTTKIADRINGHTLWTEHSTEVRPAIVQAIFALIPPPMPAPSMKQSVSRWRRG